jgi:hypothetical protein
VRSLALSSVSDMKTCAAARKHASRAGSAGTRWRAFTSSLGNGLLGWGDCGRGVSAGFDQRLRLSGGAVSEDIAWNC